MIERLILAIVLLALGVIAYKLHLRRQLRRTTEMVAAVDPVLGDARRGTSVIVYFTTPMCMPCRTVQQPALNRLQQELGEELQVIRIDATERPEDADRWGVLTAPTTFVIDAKGITRAVNHGVADYQLLKRQLSVMPDGALAS
ncbi:MAG: thioredoxin domain-containing protein [Anaerolineae bacterium]